MYNVRQNIYNIYNVLIITFLIILAHLYVVLKYTLEYTFLTKVNSSGLPLNESLIAQGRLREHIANVQQVVMEPLFSRMMLPVNITLTIA